MNRITFPKEEDGLSPVSRQAVNEEKARRSPKVPKRTKGLMRNPETSLFATDKA
jgi:hypothetical protein